MTVIEKAAPLFAILAWAAMTIALLFLLSGCGAVHYEHVTFAADGRTPTARYTLDRWQNAMDSQATSAHLRLADGTELDLQGASQQPDKTVVGVLGTALQGVLGIGLMALKMIGL